MKEIIFTSFDISEELESIIKGVGDNETVQLPEGRYLVSRKIMVKGKKGLTIRGNKTVLVSVFDPVKGFEAYKGIFDFSDCKNLSLENIVFDTDVPVNSAGVVIDKDLENNTFDVKLFEDCKLDGHQVIRAMNSMDEDGSPDYLLANYSDTPYEMLDTLTARIYCDEVLRKSVNRLPIGERICFRHALANFKIIENAAITFHSCDDTVIKDITVNSSAGMMMVVFPRSNNMTIIRYKVACPEGSNRLMASNVDAIHLLGLTGKLILKDCYFDGLGDDALNIHSTAAFITNISDNKITIINKRFSIPQPDYWCRKGDVVAVYSKEFMCKGHLMVEDYKDSCITASVIDGTYDVNDVLGNTAFYADTEITGCTIKNSRARGVLLQTENIIIKDCRFFGISRPAILLSPDIARWHEVGPVKNALIENCVIEKCPASKTEKMDAAIVVKTDHWPCSEPGNVKNVHKNIIIRNNIFKNINTDAIYVISTDGLNIENNVIDNSKLSVSPQDSKTYKLLNCTNVNLKQ